MTPIDPRTTALLAMDLQAGIISRVDDGEALVERTAGVIDAVRSAGARVGYVRVAFEDADFASVPAHSSFAPLAADAGARAGMHADAPGTQIDERVAPHDGDIVVRKTRVGPFTTTDLRDQLAAHGVDTLVLAGLSTSGVVLSTVRQAVDHDFRVIVLSDCCADRDDVVHDVLMSRVFPRQAEVVASGELVAALV